MVVVMVVVLVGEGGGGQREREREKEGERNKKHEREKKIPSFFILLVGALDLLLVYCEGGMQQFDPPWRSAICNRACYHFLRPFRRCHVDLQGLILLQSQNPGPFVGLF
jgi:hypothetical protein